MSGSSPIYWKNLVASSVDSTRLEQSSTRLKKRRIETPRIDSGELRFSQSTYAARSFRCVGFALSIATRFDHRRGIVYKPKNTAPHMLPIKIGRSTCLTPNGECQEKDCGMCYSLADSSRRRFRSPCTWLPEVRSAFRTFSMPLVSNKALM